MKPLVIPQAAQRDADAVQVLSAWVAERGLHCSLSIGMWRENGHNESRAWGILLADTIRHIANATAERYGESAPDVLAAVLSSLQDELGDPTSPAVGAFSHGHT